jgi:isopenicillin N synthase-like dioxygenase
MTTVPEIDVRALLALGPSGHGAAPSPAAIDAATEIDRACTEVGFFTIVGHGIDPAHLAKLDALARAFFARPDREKGEIAMARAGRAWRGWFPVGGELTSGVPDLKEGLYFGSELGPDDPHVRAGTPMHGANLFPRHPADLREAVLAHLDAMTRVGQAVLAGMAIGLGLEAHWFADHLTADPLVLFRIFRYPIVAARSDAPRAPDGRAAHGDPGGRSEAWGVGEHTDYGLLTLLAQDGNAGLEVRTPDGWLPVDPRSDRFVCNVGDMLERLTGGRYRSTPHRVRNDGTADRLSFPFFLDPSWDARVERLPIVERPLDDGAAARWDRTSVHGFTGTYGEYLLTKVGRVFPDLATAVTPPTSR